jgi:hypothetical protein
MKHPINDETIIDIITIIINEFDPIDIFSSVVNP